jgi:hypothetical protein
VEGLGFLLADGLKLLQDHDILVGVGVYYRGQEAILRGLPS